MSLLIRHYYRFAEFIIDTDQRVLLRNGRRVAITPKVFDTLLILTETNGRIVTKEEFMKRLWPDSFVEESNLIFNIQQLRRALGDDARRPVYIETVARRGYRFIPVVEEVLTDSLPMSEQTAQRFELSDAQAQAAADKLESETKGQPPELAIESAKDSRATVSKTSFLTVPDLSAALLGAGKRSAAVAVALVIVVAGAGFAVWRIVNDSNKSASEKQKVDRRSPAPLKLEKLTGTGQSAQVAISPDGKYLAYTHNLEKRSSIWLRQLATNTNVEIVPATNRIHGLAFANSGEYLYFVKGDPTALYRISLLGGVPKQIFDNLEGNFSVSADDSQIAFIRQAINREGAREYSLMISNSDGTGERKLLVGTHPDDLDVPVWSPDGQSIVCAYGSSVGGGQDVRLIEVRTLDGAKKELPSSRFFHIRKTAWLPDKSGLVISARKSFGENNQLWLISYPGSEIRQITEGLNFYEDLSLTANADKAVASQMILISDIWVGSSRQPRALKKITQATGVFCWTPNGQLVYSTTVSGNANLWIMQPDGAGQRQLTTDAGVEGTPAVTSDSRYIVFMSNHTGSFQVWRMGLDGANQIQLTSGVAKNFPATSPDGKWVLYNTTDDWRLWKISIDGGEPSQLSEYPARYPSVSPDGRMIACVGRIESNAEVLILPFEGGQPVKRIGLAGDFSAYRIQWTLDGKSLIYAIARNGVESLIKQPVDGGSPQEIVDSGEDDLFDFGYSADGQSLAVTRGSWHHDIVLISDLTQILK